MGVSSFGDWRVLGSSLRGSALGVLHGSVVQGLGFRV